MAVSEELENRELHVREAILRALDACNNKDWFSVIAAAQEVEIVSKVIRQDQTRHSL